jgi:hypothetical protein
MVINASLMPQYDMLLWQRAHDSQFEASSSSLDLQLAMRNGDQAGPWLRHDCGFHNSEERLRGHVDALLRRDSGFLQAILEEGDPSRAAAIYHSFSDRYLCMLMHDSGSENLK